MYFRPKLEQQHKKMMLVYHVSFPKGKASMHNETLRRGSSQVRHGLGCLSPCQDTFVQLFFFLPASLQCSKGFEESWNTKFVALLQATSWRLVEMKVNESLKD